MCDVEFSPPEKLLKLHYIIADESDQCFSNVSSDKHVCFSAPNSPRKSDGKFFGKTKALSREKAEISSSKGRIRHILR